MSVLEDDLRKRAKAIAAEANECCNRSDGYEEAIEDLALQHLAHVAADNERLQAALKPFIDADWYADGFGKFDGKVTGEDLDRAKAAHGQSRDEDK